MNVPPEILQIILRSIHSRQRCLRLVCKAWQLITDDPAFFDGALSIEAYDLAAPAFSRHLQRVSFRSIVIVIRQFTIRQDMLTKHYRQFKNVMARLHEYQWIPVAVLPDNIDQHFLWGIHYRRYSYRAEWLERFAARFTANQWSQVRLSDDEARRYRHCLTKLSYDEQSLEFCREFAELIDFSGQEMLPLEILRAFPEKVPWGSYDYSDMDAETVREFAEWIDWQQFQCSREIDSLTFEYAHLIDWQHWTKYQTMGSIPAEYYERLRPLILPHVEAGTVCIAGNIPAHWLNEYPEIDACCVTVAIERY